MPVDVPAAGFSLELLVHLYPQWPANCILNSDTKALPFQRTLTQLIIWRPTWLEAVQKTAPYKTRSTAPSTMPSSWRALPDMQLVGEDDFARRYFEQDHTRLYTNSENTLGWIRDHLAETDHPAQIEVLKDKVRFRELLADLDPGYRFEEVRLDALDTVDPTIFGGRRHADSPPH